jgi:hypothetical protein
VLPVLGDLLDADAVLLRCLEEDQDPDARLLRATLVAVPRDLPALPGPMAWAGRDGLAGVRPGDGAVAARVVEDLETGRAGVAGRPWADRGWFGAAEGWLRAELERLDRPVTGPVRQVRVWELSCVLRAPTAAGDVWFKANASFPLFINEGVVMTALAGLLGDSVPAPLAVDAERGWMVLADLP